MDVRIRVRVPVHTFGEAQGVKLQGGVFETVTREVEIECLPTEIPGEFRVDITDFMIGRQLRAGDLPLDPEKMKLVTDPQRVIARSRSWPLRVEEENARRGCCCRSRRSRRARSHQEGQEGRRGRGRRSGRGKGGREAGEVQEVAGGAFMRLIVGLGNAGMQYAWTPHNLGFLAVDRIADRAGISIERPEGMSLAGSGKYGGQDVVLAKPQTMMNLSGLAARDLLDRIDGAPEDVRLYLCDDVALPWGMLPAHPGAVAGTAGGHNGLKSVIGAVVND